MNVKKILKQLSIRTRIIIIFVFLITLTLSVLATIIFSSWIHSANEVSLELSKKTNEEISSQVESFLDNPLQLNNLNKDFIQNNYVDMLDVEERERFFVLSLKNYDDQVYSFSYGTIDGEYYGARRNSEDVIEIMRNDDSTDGYSWYYSVTEDMTANERVIIAGLFDPRIRPWYIEAVNSGQTVFSPIYKHFIIDDLAISLATPIYNQDNLLKGVLGSHIILSNINYFLVNTLAESHGSGIIIDMNSQELIANSINIQNFRVLDDNSLHRLTIDEIDNTSYKKAYDYYINNQIRSFHLDNNSSSDSFYMSEIHEEGIDWIVITSIPKSILYTNIISNIYLISSIFIFSVMIMIIIYHVYIAKVFKPINDLVEVSSAYSKGDFSRKAKIVREDEIGKLAYAFNSMATDINHFVNGLEQIVYERTERLQLANQTLKESEQRFKILHNASFGGIAIHDKGYILDCNQGLADISQYTIEELIGMNGMLLIAPDYRDYVMNQIVGGFEKPYEAFGIRKNGEVYPLRLEARNIPFEGKQVRVVEFRDLTELKQQEKEKREADQRSQESKDNLLRVMDNLPIGIAVNTIDPEVSFEYMNDYFPLIYGTDRETLETPGSFWEAVYLDESFRNQIQSLVVNDLKTAGGERKKWLNIPLERKNKKTRYISAYSTPIPNTNKFISTVIDVTEQHTRENEIIHISNHDYLTQIPNRRFFSESLDTIDVPSNYPLGIIILDINGLKLINDSFGYKSGDLTIQLVANVIRDAASKNDIFARLGGDEFGMIIPNISEIKLNNLKEKITDRISKLTIKGVNISASAGHAIKHSDAQGDVNNIIKTAEESMYKRKVLEGRSMRSSAIHAILATLTEKFNVEKIHSEKVSEYCYLIGKSMKLSKEFNEELKMAGLLHDIGKISIPDNILSKPGKLDPSEWEIMKDHTVYGFNILKAADEYSNLALYALSHHENYDGSGYPNGLSKDEIPLFARIITVVDAYEAMTSNRPYRNALSQEYAVSELIKFKNIQFDPNIVDIFINEVLEYKP